MKESRERLKTVARWKRKARENSLLIAIVLAVFAGVGLGLVLKRLSGRTWSARELAYVKYPGELFVRSVNCLVLPLVTCGVVTASSGLGKSGRVGLTALLYYLATTSLGIALGVALVQLVKPGKIPAASGSDVARDAAEINFVTGDVLLDLIRNLIPDNIVKACISQYQTLLLRPNNANDETSIYDWEISQRDTSGTNVLGLVFCSLIFGTAIGKLGPNGVPLLRFFDCLSKATLSLMSRLILATPIGIVSLTVGRILETEDFGAVLERLGAYVATVLVGLTIHGYLTLPAIYFIVTRRSPYRIIARILPALLTACGTSSSAATVPATTECLDRIGIDERISRFIVPIGATINMDGIALYETVGAIFIMQLRGLDYSLMRIVVISVTCTVSCIGAAGLPNGGYTMLIMVLNSLGVPVDDVTLIIAIDCFVDRYRTTINVIADALGSGVIEHLNKRKIDAFSNDDDDDDDR